ncbi:MAG: heme-binding protein, partial [Dehalococcoidia bacterium]
MKTAEAEAIVAAAKQQAESMGKPVSICVVDTAGLTMALVRSGDPGAMTSAIAEGKAAASAFTGRDSAQLAEMAQRVPAIVNALTTRMGGRFVALQGAVVLTRDGEIAGAVGVSGATSEEDE